MIVFIPGCGTPQSYADGAGAGGLLKVRKATTATAVTMTSFRAMRHDDSRDASKMIMALLISVGADGRIRC
jgi:hypothetical protein